jgi:outer membrane receptor protein involved in Fe transport
MAPAFAQPAPVQVAQSATAITGTVTDGAGKAIGKARITITGPSSASAESGSDGSFSVNVPPGVYTVTITASGFQSASSDVTVTAGAASLTATLLSASLTTIGRVGASTVALNNTTAASNTLTAATFTSQGQNQVVNVLDQVPGVEVFRANGGSNEPFANTSVSIRGAEPYETQVLIDGHPVNTFGNGAYGFNSSFISTQLLSDVQIEKGSGNEPNTIGNAVGGTVNFRTPQITAGPTGSFVTGIDTFDSSYYAGKFSDTFGKIGVLLGVARNVGPGYLPAQNIYGADNNYQPVGVPTTPNPSTSVGPTTYTGVVNFAYPATSDYYNSSQLVKLAYNFSQDTSIQFTNYSTQTWVDETGNNIGYVYAKIVPCITTGAAPSTTCVGPQTGNQNYTATPYLGLVGQTVPINYYAAYPSTFETDNAPLYTGEFRTVIGPGTFLARYYAGSITRDVNQQAATGYISPCYDPACEWDFDGFNNNFNDNGYPGEPYLEEFIDILHGIDGQYTLQFGPNSIVLGFDRHIDQAYFNEFYNNYNSQATAYQLSPTVSSTSFYTLQSMNYSLRGDFQLTSKLELQAAGYASGVTYIGSRFDPRLGLVFTPQSGTTVRASWGSAYVAPYYELVGETGIHHHILYVSGGTFSPETSSGYDFGADHKFGPTTLLSADLYSTTIFNRYASIGVPISGPGYTSETLVGSEGDALNQGIEVQLTHKPKFGFGYHGAVDLLRDYAYNQVVPASGNNSSLYAQLPNNGVQLPGYAYSKMQGDLYYTLHDSSYVRFSVTGYGANNAFGQPGFALLSLQYERPIIKDVTFNVGANNLGGQNNGAVGGIYNGGYTYAALGGGAGPTNYEPVEPRTVYFQLQYGPDKK